MASNVTGSASTHRRAACSRLAMVALICSAAAAQAQTGEAAANAGAGQPDDTQTAPAPSGDAPSDSPSSDPPSSDPSAPPAPPAASEPAGVGGGPKTLSLTPEQASPDNLQGWLRERNRRHPALLTRPPPPPAPSPSTATEPTPPPDSAIEGYKRRLRSFDEHGVTVLSNRHAEPVLATAPAAAALAVPAPVAAATEPEPPSFTETRSLRANPPKPRRVVSEPGLDWRLFALPVAAISLALIWLRKRRAAE